MSMWTISASGGSNSSKLAGWHIKTNAAGTAYQLTEANVNNVKDTVGPPLPTSGTLTFSFTKDGVSGWTITATLPLTPNANFNGNWTSPPIPELKGTPSQSGTYTATADGTFEEAGEAASSANV
jgi:hypothetical protein